MSNPSAFVMLTVLALVTILIIFAMRYGAQVLRARTEATHSAKADAETAALRQEIRAMDARLTRIETMLREVE